MGMNYYTRTKKCPTCEHKPEGIHLGKSSMGWQFTFQYNGGEFYKNIQEMADWLADKEIEDEYGQPVSHEEFWKMIEAKQIPQNQNHAAMMHEKYPEHKDREYIIDGYSFSDCQFS